MHLLLFAVLLLVEGITTSSIDGEVFSCSSTTVPDLDGAWVCNEDWFISLKEAESAYEGTRKWELFFQLPKFYAVSQIRTEQICPLLSDPVAVLQMSLFVWDERFVKPVNVDVADTPDENWVQVEFTDFTFVGNASTVGLYSGFARRAPFWRVTMETVGIDFDCIPSFAFFARAGVAAMQDFSLSFGELRVQKAAWKYKQAPTTDTCNKVTGIPSRVASHYKLDRSFYKKYTSTYGIPVMGSYAVDDRALQRACYVVRFLLADRDDIRSHMLSNNGRVAIIGRRETVPMVPEMRRFTSWNRRAAGGTAWIPVNVGAEENMLCERGDKYARDQDIFMHEFAHGMHLIACYTAIPDFNTRLHSAFNSARRRGLWTNTYANTNHKEYFAEGVQAYFNQQREGKVGGDGIQNHVNTKEELRRHDPTLYRIVDELFPCKNQYIPRCDDISQQRTLHQTLKTNCGGTTRTTAGPHTETPNNCRDKEIYCQYWANSGECSRNPRYMLSTCPKSCKSCTTPTTTPRTVATRPPTTTTTTTTRATTTRGSRCRDNDRHCSYWASTGECSRNPTYMRQNCRRSCNLCTSRTPNINASPPCKDLNKNCSGWTGYCASNDYVIKNCKRSCGRCKK